MAANHEAPGVLVIWLNGTVGSGKTAVGRALAAILPNAFLVDGDDHAGPAHLHSLVRWRMAMDRLLRIVRRSRRPAVLVVAYPLECAGHARLRAACGRAHRRLVVVNLAPPLAMTLRGRGGRQLSAGERARVREMRSEGYHRRPYAALTWPNAQGSAAHTACQIARRLTACGSVS
jgi:hypothetical protein